MSFHGRTARGFAYAALSASTLFIAAPAAQAGLFFTAELRETYEDNVAGLVADNPNAGAADDNASQAALDDNGGGRGRGSPQIMRSKGKGGGGLDDVTPAGGVQKQGDFATELYAGVGASVPVTADTAIIVQTSAQHTAYLSFDQFDFTIFGASLGARKRFSEIISARASINGKIKTYDNPLRDSTAYGAVLSVSEQLGRSFRLRQFYGYEKNSADSPLYSYRADTVGLRAGFELSPALSFGAGYSYLRREYESPSSFIVTAKTLSLDVVKNLVGRWNLIVGYDRDVSESNVPGTASTNNIYGVGIQYAY